MKKLSFKLIALAFIASATVSCKKNKEVKTSEAKPVVEVTASETYKAIPTETLISWDAKKIVGGHQGTINASAGVLELKGGKLVGGNFIFDINSIKATDIPAEEESYGKLIGHLKAPDFFDVEKFPNAAFAITGVSEKEGKSVISGNLTIKGVKKNIEFPATVTVSGNSITIVSDEFSIDRTEFDIKYSSGKFTDPAKLGDYLIKDNVGIKVNAVAKK